MTLFRLFLVAVIAIVGAYTSVTIANHGMGLYPIFFGDIADQHGHTDGHASLASRAVGRANQGIHSLLNVGIGHHHHVIFSAAQGLNAFAVARAVFVQAVGNRGGAHKADGFDIGVFDQCINRFFVALHHVEHAVGQARLLEQVGHEQTGAGVERAGLQDKAVTAGNGHWEHPHGHHDGEVKGCDARHHAQGLTQRPVVDAGRDLIGEVAFEQLWNATGKLNNVDAPRNFTLCIGKHFAMLGGDHARQGIAVLVQQL